METACTAKREVNTVKSSRSELQLLPSKLSSTFRGAEKGTHLGKLRGDQGFESDGRMHSRESGRRGYSAGPRFLSKRRFVTVHAHQLLGGLLDECEERGFRRRFDMSTRMPWSSPSLIITLLHLEKQQGDSCICIEMKVSISISSIIKDATVS